ncbi:MAG: HD domain-containing protein [Defluviitaleaceae bacterium]|nr:HD domain-containing protein [Defluviitaleaceae bacterium]
MMIKIPQGALWIIEKLSQAGFDGFVVGGCVRDSLLGKSPKDWDITTPATPEEINHVFADQKRINIGQRHGTISVKSHEDYYEVTTYRVDGVYSDGRRPDEVSFTKELTTDLARRDFTVNAMAFSPQAGLVDPFGGAKDLQSHLIRCVGDPATRFGEDYLRIIRAYRFAAVLGFDLEEDTRMEAVAGKHNLNLIARERVQTELAKLFTSENFSAIEIFLEDCADVVFPEVAGLQGIIQNNDYHIYDVFRHTLEVLRHSSPTLHQRIAALFHDTGKARTKTTDQGGIDHFKGHEAVSVEIAKKSLKHWCFDNATTARALDIVKYHGRTILAEKTAIKRFISKVGEQTAADVLEFQIADNLAKSQKAVETTLPRILKARKMLEQVLEEGEPTTVKDLAITGKDVMTLLNIPPSQAVGDHLARLLELVIEEPTLNTKETLTRLLLKEVNQP